MYFFFADDSKQKSRFESNRDLISMGCIFVKHSEVKPLEDGINQLCTETGFPPNEEFKWSPHRNMWMYRNLVGEARIVFFKSLIRIIKERDVKAISIIEDINYQTTNGRYSGHNLDVIKMLIERIDCCLERLDEPGIIISDKPGGKSREEGAFLNNVQAMIQKGTEYVDVDYIAFNAVATFSRNIRLLQTADVITGCTLARVCGSDYSFSLFEDIKDMFDRTGGRISGVGLKIHPDLIYRNLYHWILGEGFYLRGSGSIILPSEEYKYYQNPYSQS